MNIRLRPARNSGEFQPVTPGSCRSDCCVETNCRRSCTRPCVRYSAPDLCPVSCTCGSTGIRSVSQRCPSNLTLLEYLRCHSLTGATKGCAEGDCGACSVAMVERDAAGNPAYHAVNSCLVPVCLLAGREVISVEGVGGSASLTPCSGPWPRATAPNAANARLVSSARFSKATIAPTFTRPTKTNSARLSIH
jgi:hypothetical protein